MAALTVHCRRKPFGRFTGYHREAAQQRIRRALGNRIDLFLEEIANGDEVDPANIRPELLEARSDARTGDLFRFASLLWSIPVSQGYGRRLRYLVKDRANGKLIGIFALGDPVFNLRVRDEWIGWNQAERRERLVNLMDAYVVGAVPPYAELLGGKLVASLIALQRGREEVPGALLGKGGASSAASRNRLGWRSSQSPPRWAAHRCTTG